MARPIDGVLARVRSFFLAPAAVPGLRAAVAARALPSLAVVGTAPEARAVSAALAVVVARRAGASHALVAGWGAGAPRGARMPPVPGAGRAAATLRARGHHATASGRLVRLRLAADAVQATGELGRAWAAVQAPAVVAVTATRDAAIDRLLASQDGVIHVHGADEDPALTLLAVSGLGALGVPVASLPALPRGPVSLLTTAGIGAPGALAEQLAGAVAETS